MFANPKDVFMYVLALIVLFAPAIILGWIGLTLLSWPGLIGGVVFGLAIFWFSVSKVAASDAADDDAFAEPIAEQM